MIWVSDIPYLVLDLYVLLRDFFYRFLLEGKQITKSWVKNGKVLKDNLDYLDLFLLLIIYGLHHGIHHHLSPPFWEMIVWVTCSKHIKQANRKQIQVFVWRKITFLGPTKKNFAQPLQSLFWPNKVASI